MPELPEVETTVRGLARVLEGERIARVAVNRPDLRRPGRYPVRVKGQALAARGIRDGDILVADAAAEPRPGKVCVAMVGGDVILATLTRQDEAWVLLPSSGALITIADDVEVWAIVEALIRVKI